MNLVRSHWQLVLIPVLVFALWNTPVVFPVKVLVVFLHELSHGLAAVLTGGSIVAISLSVQQGGEATTLGGNGFIILSAGYLGSLLFGVAMLLVAVRTHADRALLAMFGLVLLVVAALYIRDLFAFAFCAIAGISMLGVARYLSRDINDFILRTIGLTSIIYVPYDIFSDTIARSELHSDAYMLAEQYGGTTMFWGGLWLGLSVVMIVISLRYTFAGPVRPGR
ncbi:MAG: M50 family metallopeptidase [Rhodobacteraceae bacterium]|nr:M50 family metallopeptidase [Paracoccaceae bacterium]